MRSFDDDEIWNEHQWEVHLNEMEQKSEEIRTFIESSLGEDRPRWTRFLNGFPTKLDAVDAYIEDELMFEDAYFPDDEDDWEEDDEDMDDFFMSAEDEDFDTEDFDDGEEWKQNLHKQPDDVAETIDWLANTILADGEETGEIKLYDEARELAADMLKLAELVPKEEQDEDFLKMVSETINLGAKIAGAFAFGFELDVLGGNIAYCKRALQSANEVLRLLASMKHRAFMRFVDYESMHERMFDLRNDLGVYIQELREELDEGLELG